MAKFCGKCGSPLNENGLCPNCDQSPFESEMTSFNPQQYEPDQNDAFVINAYHQAEAYNERINAYDDQTVQYDDPNNTYGTQPEPYKDPYNTPAEAHDNPDDPIFCSPEPNRPVGSSAGKTVLIVFLLLLFASVITFALNYFHIVEIPGVSNLVSLIQGKNDNDKDQTVTEPSTESKTPPKTTQTTTEEDDTAEASDASVQNMIQSLTLFGYLDSESYVSGNKTGEIAVLYLDNETEFDVFPPYDSVYGNSVSTDEVQILGNNPFRYCGKNVTVTGELVFASTELHRKTVLLQNSKITLIENEEEDTVEEYIDDGNDITGEDFPIRLDEAAGSGSKLNIRSGPGYDYDVVTKIVTGTYVTILKQQNGWSYVDYGSGQGWCNTLVAGLPSDDSMNSTIDVYDTDASDYQTNGAYNRVYTPDMAVDSNKNTCWMVKTDDAGAGCWIMLDLGSEQTVHGIKMLNGNSWNGRYNGEVVSSTPFKNNGRIKEFTVYYGNGDYQMFTAKDVQEDSFGANIFYFDEAVETNYIELYVDSTYTGSKYPETVCLSEIAVF